MRERPGHARYERQRRLDLLYGRRRMVPGLAAARMLQALAAKGHPQSEIARHLGVSPEQAAKWQAGVDRITRRTEIKIGHVYADLRHSWGGSIRSVRRAERKGWPPPEAWDDLSIRNPWAEWSPPPRSVTGFVWWEGLGGCQVCGAGEWEPCTSVRVKGRGRVMGRRHARG